MITLKEYRAAEELVKNFKVCEHCDQVFRIDTGGNTIYFGNEKWWCGLHFKAAMDELKEDMRG